MEDSLETLFSFAPPEQLRQSVMEVFFAWLIESPVLPQNYKQVSEDVYFLLKALEKQETQNSE